MIVYILIGHVAWFGNDYPIYNNVYLSKQWCEKDRKILVKRVTDNDKDIAGVKVWAECREQSVVGIVGHTP